MNAENTQPAAEISYLMGLLSEMDGAASHTSLIEFDGVEPQEIEYAVAAGLVELFEENGERGVRVTSRGANLYGIG